MRVVVCHDATMSRRWMAAVLICAGALAGCTSGRAVSASTTSSSASPAVASSPSAALSSPSVTPALLGGLASPDYTGTGTAHGCAPQPGTTLSLTANPDGFQPNLGCVALRPGQRLEVKNNTNGFGQVGASITMSMRGLPSIRVARGETVAYPKPISSYLAPGQHYGICACPPGNANFDLWVLP